jgi:hypothetical protein
MYNGGMKERKQHNHKCCHCGENIKSNEKPHPSLKVSHIECAFEACKKIREKVQKSC